MNTNQQGQMALVRAVFQAMFDAVCVAPDFNEERWIDFIAAFNTTGRLLFGYPHLESSESDIFGALDDIAFQLAATKDAIEQTTKEARIVMHELHEVVGPPDEPESELSAPEPTNSPVPRADETPDPVSIPEPRTGNDHAAAPPSAVHPVQVGSTWMLSERDPQRPNEHDERLFAVIREDPTISMAAAERAVGMAQSRGIQRMKLLDGYGTLPADIKEWRETRAKTRGVPKGVHSQTLGKELTPRAPAPQTIADALAVPSFDDRRKESAREASERTWRERHQEARA